MAAIRTLANGDYRAANGVPRTVVYTASKTFRLLIFATPPTEIGSPRYKTLLSALVNAGHEGRPGPFGLPDLAKLTQ